MNLISENKGFQIYFDTFRQVYHVFKDGKFLIGDKYKYSQVKCYLD
jgi:hypothetical protein